MWHRAYLQVFRQISTAEVARRIADLHGRSRGPPSRYALRRAGSEREAYRYKCWARNAGQIRRERTANPEVMSHKPEGYRQIVIAKGHVG